MDSPLVVVFLAVIGVTALLQAGFVGAIAYAARLAGRRLAEFDEKFEADVVPQIRRAAKLTDKAAGVSEKSLAHARRVDSMLAEASSKAERQMAQAAVRLEGAVERAAVRVDAELAERTARVSEHRILRKLSGAAAFAKGVQRALEVWQSAAAAQETDIEEKEEDDDGDLTPNGGPPASPRGA